MTHNSDLWWLFLATCASAAVIGLLLLAVRSHAAWQRRLLTRQTAAGSATVFGLKETHSSVGEQPLMKIRLGIRFNEGGPYTELDLETTVSPFDAHRIQPGAELQVRFEPTEPDNFSVDFGGVTGVVLAPSAGRKRA